MPAAAIKPTVEQYHPVSLTIFTHTSITKQSFALVCSPRKKPKNVPNEAFIDVATYTTYPTSRFIEKVSRSEPQRNQTHQGLTA